MKKIPKGETRTYKQIGEEIGSKAYRAIGQALRKNPYPIIIPCHRVIKSDGTIGGYFGKINGKNVERKKELLMKERVIIVQKSKV